jgi:hypothetical protein
MSQSVTITPKYRIGQIVEYGAGKYGEIISLHGIAYWSKDTAFAPQSKVCIEYNISINASASTIAVESEIKRVVADE